jgi:uncharacterized protein YlxP (DUF503 family)
MVIGSLQVELFLPGLRSLKEKRFILKSLKTRIRNRFNVSVAEIEYFDKWQRSRLGIVCVSNETRFVDEMMNKVLNLILGEDRVEVLDQVLEFL